MAITHSTTATGGDSGGLIGQTAWNAAHTGIAGDGGFSFKYTFSTGTSGTPSSGGVQLNSVTPSSATIVYIHETDATSTGIDLVLDLLNPNDYVMLSNSDRSTFQVYQRTSVRFISGANIDSMPVIWLCGTGSGATNFSDAETVFVSILHADQDDVYGQTMAMQRALYF